MDVLNLIHGAVLFDSRPLGLHTPEHVAAGEIDFVGIIGRALGVDPVDSSVLFIPVRGDIGVPLAAFGVQSRGPLIRGRVVLDNDIVPVTDPECSIRPDLRADGSGPGISRVIDVVRLLLEFESGTLGLAGPLADELAGRRADEGDIVPVTLGKSSGGVEGVSRGGCVAVVSIDLSDIRGTREEEGVIVCPWSAGLAQAGLFVIAAGEGEVKTGVCVRC